VRTEEKRREEKRREERGERERERERPFGNVVVDEVHPQP
jgi:hypothetical protein